MWRIIKDDELYHHGIKGQKWGVRRFQNPDGTLTSAGRRRLYKASKGTYHAPEGYDALRKSLSQDQRARLSSANRKMQKAEKEAEKKADQFHREHANRVKEKLGPNYNVKTDIKKAEKVWNEEFFKDTPERREMLKADKNSREARKQLEKTGEDVAKELLGSYASKSTRSLIGGKEQAYVSLGRMAVNIALTGKY